MILDTQCTWIPCAAVSHTKGDTEVHCWWDCFHGYNPLELEGSQWWWQQLHWHHSVVQVQTRVNTTPISPHPHYTVEDSSSDHCMTPAGTRGHTASLHLSHIQFQWSVNIMTIQPVVRIFVTYGVRLSFTRAINVSNVLTSMPLIQNMIFSAVSGQISR